MCDELKLRPDPPRADETLALLAFAKGLRGERVPPLGHAPLVISPDACLVARWGWPGFDRPLALCRSETAATTRTWADAWRNHRGVVPVAGWHEGDRSIDAPGAYLAVLWMAHGDDLRFAVLTQEPQADRPMPVPLTGAGALAWLAGGGFDDQVRDLRGYGQETLFPA